MKLPDIEQLVIDAYSEAFIDGIVEGRKQRMDSIAKEAPRHVIDQSYEASRVKSIAIQVADKYEL